MSNQSSNMARRAFDAMAAVGLATSISELRQATEREFRELGIDMAVGGIVHSADDRHTVDFLFGDLENEWCRHYIAQRWSERSPVLKASRSTTEPVFWSSLRASTPSLDEHDLFAEAAAFGLNDGHVLMLEQGYGSMVVATAASSTMDDPQARLTAHCLSLHFGLQGFKLWRQDYNEVKAAGPPLTDRQLECLRWVRDGKSAWEIGAIMGLSARTIEEHLRNACERLAVRSRTQAVVEAARRGLIGL